MPVRKLTESGSFAPESLDIIYGAFDDAWAEMAARIGPDPTAIDFARIRLAQAVLVAAETGEFDRQRIKAEAVQAFLSTTVPSD